MKPGKYFLFLICFLLLSFFCHAQPDQAGNSRSGLEAGVIAAMQGTTVLGYQSLPLQSALDYGLTVDWVSPSKRLRIGTGISRRQRAIESAWMPMAHPRLEHLDPSLHKTTTIYNLLETPLFFSFRVAEFKNANVYLRSGLLCDFLINITEKEVRMDSATMPVYAMPTRTYGSDIYTYLGNRLVNPGIQIGGSADINLNRRMTLGLEVYSNIIRMRNTEWVSYDILSLGGQFRVAYRILSF